VAADRARRQHLFGGIDVAQSIELDVGLQTGLTGNGAFALLPTDTKS